MHSNYSLSFAVKMRSSVLFGVLLAIIISIQEISGGCENVFEEKDRAVLNFTEAAARDGYLTEEHRVETADGYVLTTFRLRQRTRCAAARRPAVLLMHGLLQSAHAWLDAGRGAALAYLLADECYDLWLGNVRGSYYSRKHVTLDPVKDSEFWNFSLNEVGVYDLPAIVDYMLHNTKADRINYIGYSQSGGALLMMCSERPGYCGKLRVAVLLNPAARMKHTKSWLFRLLNKFYETMEPYLLRAPDLEALPVGSVLQKVMAGLCSDGREVSVWCRAILEAVDSSHPGSIAAATIRSASAHFPAGTSARSLAWFSQTLNANSFRKFDYGSVTNLFNYGKRKPPLYNMTATDVPVVIIYGKNDHIVSPEDVTWLRDRLPNVLETFPVGDALWNHFDTPYSKHNKRMTFPKINEYLTKFTH